VVTVTDTIVDGGSVGVPYQSAVSIT